MPNPIPAVGQHIRLSPRGPSGTVKAHFVADLHDLGEQSTYLVLVLDHSDRGYLAGRRPGLFISTIVVHPDGVSINRGGPDE